MGSWRSWHRGLVAAWVVACAPAVYGEDDESVRLPPRNVEVSRDDATPSQRNAADRPAARVDDAGTASFTPTPRPAPSASDASAPAKATPRTQQTFGVGSNECNGGHCNGGYDDDKDVRALATAGKLCVDRGFTRALDFTIGDQPGGRFCTWSGTSYGCDSDCDGCNTMTSVTCEKP